MAVKLHPEKSIVPVVRVSQQAPGIQLLGTGFFVGAGSALHVVTAGHVIRDNPIPKGDHYAIAFAKDGDVKFFPTGMILGSDKFDIAACEYSPAHLPDAVPLLIGRGDPALNADIISFEYSGTRVERTPAGDTLVSFEPSAHKGNIVRSYVSMFPEKRDTPAYLVSFPALKGASGAPLLTGKGSKESGVVVGMIVENVESDLLPARVIKVQDGDDVHEEIRYYLPQGKALACSTVARSLEEIGVRFTYAEEELTVSGSLPEEE